MFVLILGAFFLCAAIAAITIAILVLTKTTTETSECQLPIVNVKIFFIVFYVYN